MTPGLEGLPSEILEEIFSELEYDRDALDALGLTCRTLFACTSLHRFPTITLHNNNFNHFMQLTCAVPWNGILPNVQRLVFGTKMFPLSRGYIGKPKAIPEFNYDFSRWAPQFHTLRSFDLRGATWSQFPPCFAEALLHLRAEYLVVCLRTLSVEDLRKTILPSLLPKMLSISGPLWAQKAIPPTPSYFPESDNIIFHYMQLDESVPITDLIRWFRTCDAPPSLVHLYIELPKEKESPYGLAISELSSLVSPVHLHLKLPSTAQDYFEFPVKSFNDLKTLQISSIYNDSHLFQTTSSRKIGDIPLVCFLLKQFSILNPRLKAVQLDTVCTHLNLIFGGIPQVLEEEYPSLRSFTLTLRSGKFTSRKHLDDWLEKSAFIGLRRKGVELNIEAGGSDPVLLWSHR
ncbi:hypothetical protein AGABI1DRAFT_131303 [Agaricus bisporus var. burnettii JB137-S8]|uniref:F-box domain-containing protein n=1 Tax=Agaricus bisporus var. burnettii (strain JB137-S8 / ATCC MYA-4627 / FGSC 10392) TaxID=597362 RepID=K5X0R0_AGABU|nr:uncharacterized protein AGABI1DRAFT_131303 [Agaricus bisporus var. burnettii JB137-S8]EKM76477.1 hypothetical protein AGABI1DRAFT_131303 [Agaricus bisporus var. burnettii JB137-S8]